MTLRVIALALLVAAPAGQAPASLQDPFDHLLDTYVRDGRVYYRALKKERAPLDRYIASLDVPAAQVAAWPKASQEAFWIDAYNAIVLQTVIDHYPIHGTSAAYPANSIRQIPGAFDHLTHRIAGRSITLDQIETTVLTGFGDARLFLALGRGAIGSNRLRSEAYRGASLARQLDAVVKECAQHLPCVTVDIQQNTLAVTPIVSWRANQFVQTFVPTDGMWADRSPVERAAVGMVYPYLFPNERAFLAKDTFQMTFQSFDWRLNDLGVGSPPVQDSGDRVAAVSPEFSTGGDPTP
jgi:Protein of unknown function, DUF547